MNRRRRLSMSALRPGRKEPGSVRQRCRGVSTLDYVLVMGIILPLAAFVIPTGKRMIQLVYEMITVLISWPFM